MLSKLPSPLPVFLALLLPSSAAWSLEFHCMAFQDSYSGIHFMSGPEADSGIEINEYGLSPKYSYNGTSPLTFFTKSTGGEGETIRTPVAQFPFDQRYTKLLLIFYPNPQQEGTYQIYPIPSDNQSMPPGSYRVQNQTRKQVAMLLNGKTYQFSSGQFQVVTPPPAKRETFEIEITNPEESDSEGNSGAETKVENVTAAARIPVHLAYQTEAQQWETFFRKKWLYRPDIRTFVFIYNIDGVIQTKNFVEFIQP